MSDLIEQLKDPKLAQPFGIYEKYYPEKAEVLKKADKQNCLRFYYGDNWIEPIRGPFEGSCTYILRPGYQPELEWKNRVFASTCDKSKGANNIIGVTAHCNCGNVFCDDVVHGKEHPQSTFQPHFLDMYPCYATKDTKSMPDFEENHNEDRTTQSEM